MKLQATEVAVVHVPPGKYRAAFHDIESIEAKGGYFATMDDIGSAARECYRWNFDLCGDFDGTVSGLTSRKVNSLSKAYRFLQALLGEAPKIAEDIDTDKLRGKEAIVVLEDVKLGSGVVSRVVDVLPISRK